MMRGFAGAVVNNLYLMNTKATKLYMLIIAGLLATYFITGNEGVLAWSAFAVLMAIPMAALENAMTPFTTNWTAFENVWGISPGTMVLSRYATVIGLSIVCIGLWIAIPIFDIADPFGNMSMAVVVLMVQFTCIVYYPLLYLLNPKKDGLSIILLFVSILLGGVLGFVMELVMENFMNGSHLLMGVAVVGIYVVSIALSIAFNTFHRGRVR